MVVLTVDIGGTNLRLAIVDNGGQIVKFDSIKTASLPNSDFVGALVGLIADFANIPPEWGRLAAVAVGIPGIVDAGSTIISCPNVTQLENSSMKQRLEEDLNVPVYLDKDVNFILYGDYWTLELSTYRNVIGVYIGTGFGCSLIINGDLFRGASGFSGEVGHIPLKGHHRPCNCGNTGCLELYGAGRSVVERSAIGGCSPADFFFEGKEEQVTEFLDYAALGIITMVNIFDPEAIVIGGGVPQMQGFPVQLFQAKVLSGLRSDIHRKRLQILYSKSGDYGACLGAAKYVFDRLDCRG